MILLFIVDNFKAAGQCPPGSVSLSSQAAVDQFSIDYPNCTMIQGELYIAGSNVTDISGLKNLVSINGNLSFHQTSCDTIDLSALQSISGHLYFHQNSVLELIDLSQLSTGVNSNVYSHLNTSLVKFDLSNLLSIGDFLYVFGNVSLETFALTSLSSIGGDFDMDNTGITDLHSLSALNEVNGDFTLTNNFNLTDCSGLCTLLQNDGVAGNIEISNNPSECSTVIEITDLCGIIAPICPENGLELTSQLQIDTFLLKYPDCTKLKGSLSAVGFDISDVSGLSQLTSINGDIVFSNTSCSSIELPNVDSIFGGIYLHQNVFLQDFKLPSLFYGVVKQVYSHNNTMLSILNLESIQSIGDSLYLHNNSSLDTFNLNTLESIIGNFYLHNSGLQNLDYLENLNSVHGNFTLTGNAGLTSCSGICPLISNNGVTGNVTILNNPAPCNSEEDLIPYCAISACDGEDLIINAIVQDEYFASHSIIASGVLLIPQNVSFTALNHVSLNLFEVETGSELEVYIDHCRE